MSYSPPGETRNESDFCNCDQHHKSEAFNAADVILRGRRNELSLLHLLDAPSRLLSIVARRVELHVGRMQRLDVPLKGTQDPSLRFIPFGMVVMYVSAKNPWLTPARTQ